jgi:cobalt-precorrin-5B (C1)-methyltransferase
VIKDSGDDPDVTNGIKIYATVSILTKEQFQSATKNNEFIYENSWILAGGEGIGRVTKAGLEQELGYPAINKIPRKMILEVVKEVCELADYRGKLRIEISAPQGVEIAKKTFNSRLGILGGISILGTSGIVEPMSEKALVATIEAELKMKKAEGRKHLLMTPGNIGKSYADTLLKLEDQEIVKCSNYIGDSIDLAVSLGFQSILLIGNIGKLVKLGAGIMNTHSKVADGRLEILALYSGLCGASIEDMKKILDCLTTEIAIDKLKEKALLNMVMDLLMNKIDEVLTIRGGDTIKVGVMIYSDKLGYLGETRHVKELMQYHM